MKGEGKAFEITEKLYINSEKTPKTGYSAGKSALNNANQESQKNRNSGTVLWRKNIPIQIKWCSPASLFAAMFLLSLNNLIIKAIH